VVDYAAVPGGDAKLTIRVASGNTGWPFVGTHVEVFSLT